jgi:ubiquinone/menaquinone biosynthesis C-methylase UbiE
LTSADSQVSAPSIYWEARARRFALRARGLAAVCSYGMPWLYNMAIDLCQRRALAPWLIGRSNACALDVGCGIGRWSIRLAARGMAVTGIDLSDCMLQRASDRARERQLACSFLKADATDLQLNRCFDLVLSITVLQHIVDPDQAALSILNLATHVAPKGELVLLEAAPTHDCRRCDSGTFRARTLDWYRGALARAGFRICAVRGVDPLPLKRLMLPQYQRMPASFACLSSNAVAAISLPLDWMFAPYFPNRSWHKVIVARRASERSS